MSSKEVKFGADARFAIQKGVNIAGDAVAVTYGPRGRNAIIERPGNIPLVTKDGISVIKAISLKDPMENMGVVLLKTAAAATNRESGDGTSATTILTQKIYNEGLKAIASSHNPVLLKRGLDLGLSKVLPFLSLLAKQVNSEDIIKKVATISTNNDVELGNLIGQVVSTIGDDGLISIEDGTGFQTSVTYSEGMQIAKGYCSPAFVSNMEKLTCELDDCFIVLYDDKLSRTEDLLDIVQKVYATGKSVLFIAREIELDALASLVINREKANLKVAAIKAPGFGDTRADMLGDIAACVGGKVFTNQNGRALKDAELEDLGRARKVIVGRNATQIIDAGGSKESVNSRVRLIKSQMADSSSFQDQKATMKERLAKLSGCVAVIRVGAQTEAEMREKKDRIEDALGATRASIQSGIVPGGGSALLQASKMLESFITEQKNSDLLVEEIAGLTILKNAMREPFLQIMRNSGIEHYEAMQKILSLGGFAGFDALRGVFCSDMLETGIIDPLLVIKSGISNAVSAASTLLTTEVAIFRDMSDEMYE